MGNKLRLSELFEDKKSVKTILMISVVLLLVIEIAIYVAALNQSGLKSRMVVENAGGVKIYESPGPALSSYERMQFESNYGQLSNYNTHVETEMVPFPMRSWVLMAIGIPITLILLVAFVVQVWIILLNGDHSESGANLSADSDKTRVGSFLGASRNFSVLHLGFVIVLAILILWLVPSFLGDAAKYCLATMKENNWIFLGVAGFAGGLIVWIIYLRYKLSKKMLDNQFEIEKYRIKTQLLTHQESPHMLSASGGEKEVRDLGAEVL